MIARAVASVLLLLCSETPDLHNAVEGARLCHPKRRPPGLTI